MRISSRPSLIPSGSDSVSRWTRKINSAFHRVERGADTSGEKSCLQMATDPATTGSSYIGKGARISGKVDFGEMARIEGEAEGEITGDYIEIAPSAVVMARITANTLKVSGHVNGEIVAREHIELLPTAQLQCTIISPTVVGAESAQFGENIKIPDGQTSSLESGIKRMKRTKRGQAIIAITQAQKAELRERGYSDDDIALMIPAVAHHILGLQ